MASVSMFPFSAAFRHLRSTVNGSNVWNLKRRSRDGADVGFWIWWTLVSCSSIALQASNPPFEIWDSTMFSPSLERMMVMLPRTRSEALRCIKMRQVRVFMQVNVTMNVILVTVYTISSHPTPCLKKQVRDVRVFESHRCVHVCAVGCVCAVHLNPSGSLSEISDLIALCAEKVTTRHVTLSISVWDEDSAQVAGISGKALTWISWFPRGFNLVIRW